MRRNSSVLSGASVCGADYGVFGLAQPAHKRSGRVPMRHDLRHRRDTPFLQTRTANHEVGHQSEQAIVNIAGCACRTHRASPWDLSCCPKTHEESLLSHWFSSKTVRQLTLIVRLAYPHARIHKRVIVSSPLMSGRPLCSRLFGYYTSDFCRSKDRIPVNFLHDLRRRRMFRLIGLYIVGAWIIIQVGDALFPGMGNSLKPLCAIVIIAASVVFSDFALVFGWIYDITSNGIVRTQTSWATTSPSTSACKRAGLFDTHRLAR